MHSRGSLFGPLLLILIGALLLARHVLPAVRIGEWIAHYWPVILILWGVTRLIEHFTAPNTHRGLSGGEIVLLMFIVFFGLAWSGVYRFRDSRMAQYWGINVGDWNPFLQSYSFTAAAQGTVAPGRTVVVRGYRGDVHVVAVVGTGIAAQLTDTVKAESADAARQLFDAAQPVIRAEGDEIVVLPAGDQYRREVNADLRLSLPSAVPLTVTLQNGDITVSDWRADLNLATTHGDVTAHDINGSVSVASGHDNVSLDHITGGASVYGSGDDVTLANIDAPALLRGEFVGTLNLSHLPRGIQFTSSRTNMTIAALPGSVIYDMGQIKVVGADGITLHTRDEGIDIDEFTGPVVVQDRNETVTLKTATPPAGAIAVTDQNADIHLALPGSSQFTLDATSRNGDIDSDFAVQKSGNGRQSQAHAVIGADGPHVSLNATNGNITLTRN